VQTQHRLDVQHRGLPVHLYRLPRFRVVAEGAPSRLRGDVATGHDVVLDRGQEPVGVGLPRERLLALLAVRPAIEAFLRLRITNARTEGANRVIKQIKCVGCGYRNQSNYERRILLHVAAKSAA